jgi:uncharacterized protein YeaC (DUF1315 family)
MPTRGPYKKKPAAERFARFTERAPNGCLLWTGYKFAPNGEEQEYRCGQFSYLGKPELATRVAFHLAHGRWPEPCALHTCDNGLCVEPSHLYEGTKHQNTADMVSRDRHSIIKVSLTEQLERDVQANYLLCRVTQQQLAERFGISRHSVNKIVNRKASEPCSAP